MFSEMLNMANLIWLSIRVSCKQTLQRSACIRPEHSGQFFLFIFFFFFTPEKEAPKKATDPQTFNQTHNAQKQAAQ